MQDISTGHHFVWVYWGWLPGLTHFRPMFPFYTPWKRFLTFSGGIEREHWPEMDQWTSISKDWDHKRNKGSGKFTLQHGWTFITTKSVKHYFHDTPKGVKVWGLYKQFELKVNKGCCIAGSLCDKLRLTSAN